MQSHIGRDRALIVLLIAGVALNLGAVRLANRRVYSRPPVTPLPLEFEGWKGIDTPTRETTQAILPHARITTITYEKAGVIPVQVNVIASRDPNDLHTPERCLTGYGATITDREVMPLQVGGAKPGAFSMNQLASHDSTSNELLLYCYDNVPNLGATWTTRVMMKLMPMAEPAYFVRFSTPMESDVKTARTRLMEFAAKYMEARLVWETPAAK